MKLPRIAPIVVVPFALLFTACGIRFTDPPPGTEFFESLQVSGERTAGSPLTALVSYTQTYPVEVELTCELRQNKQTLFEIGKNVVPPVPDGNPDATPVVGSFSYDFTPPAPGAYRVECLTLREEDNFISKKITISAD
ncbi:MAG: hypothetical protein HY873_09740 [Chloroflexi bacterium]|nr:hypothetical protein [Chloroflexota bacterium]